MSPDEYRQWAAQLRDEAERLEAQARTLRKRAAELDDYANRDEQCPPSVEERLRRLFD
jgi:hypothetical protein